MAPLSPTCPPVPRGPLGLVISILSPKCPRDRVPMCPHGPAISATASGPHASAPSPCGPAIPIAGPKGPQDCVLRCPQVSPRPCHPRQDPGSQAGTGCWGQDEVGDKTMLGTGQGGGQDGVGDRMMLGTGRGWGQDDVGDRAPRSTRTRPRAWRRWHRHSLLPGEGTPRGAGVRHPRELLPRGRPVTRWWPERRPRSRPTAAPSPAVPAGPGLPAAPPAPAPAPAAASPARAPRHPGVPLVPPRRPPGVPRGRGRPPALTSSRLFSSLLFSRSRSFLRAPSAAVNLEGPGVSPGAAGGTRCPVAPAGLGGGTCWCGAAIGMGQALGHPLARGTHWRGAPIVMGHLLAWGTPWCAAPTGAPTGMGHPLPWGTHW